MQNTKQKKDVKDFLLTLKMLSTNSELELADDYKEKYNKSSIENYYSIEDIKHFLSVYKKVLDVCNCPDMDFGFGALSNPDVLARLSDLNGELISNSSYELRYDYEYMNLSPVFKTQISMSAFYDKYSKELERLNAFFNSLDPSELLEETKEISAWKKYPSLSDNLLKVECNLRSLIKLIRTFAFFLETQANIHDYIGREDDDGHWYMAERLNSLAERFKANANKIETPFDEMEFENYQI